MSHTWYLATDMQFYVIAPLIIIALHKKPRLGIFLICILSAISAIITFTLTLTQHFPAVPYMSDIV